MRIKLNIVLEHDKFPKDYNTCMLSFFKYCLSKYQGGEYAEIFYPSSSPNVKTYTFAVALPSAEFKSNEIIIPNKRFSVTFSTFDYTIFLILHNAILKQKNHVFALPLDNKMKLESINLIKDKTISKNEIKIKMKSALCVREHDRETNKDYYLSYKSENFSNMIKIITKEKLKRLNLLNENIVDGFEIEVVNAKKTVSVFHGQKIEVSIGEFILRGNPILLNYLYSAGIASRCSAGYGCFDIVN